MNRIILLMLLTACTCYAENIDPYADDSQYAYGENVGWLNFEPITAGVQVASDKLTGYVWAENIGWISLSCDNTSTCLKVKYGVTNDGSGNLSGYAWAENVGWINFDPKVPRDLTDYGVTIDTDGNFNGWAYGENIGWIHLASKSPVPYGVKACVVTLDDLQNFASYWLDSGAVAGNLDNTGKVNNSDFAILASYWLDFCPNGWLLK
ncbi:MAG: hypothetical protein FVQ82_11525 [Planctomycetes bacterium]|nr:hypothetical protein [Planctomycetota bacterium]